MTETEVFRSQMPPPLAPRPLNLPEHVEITLPNGLGLVVVEDKRLPLISFRLAFRSGDANDPEELPGLSDMMSGLLTEGTLKRNSRQIAEEVERFGATLAVGSSSDFTTVAASSISLYADEILDLMADVTLNPSFPQNEVDLTRENTKQLLIQQRAQPTFLASERLSQVVFGKHPYSRLSPTPEMLDLMTRDHLVKYRETTYIPNNAVFMVVGDVDRDSIIQRIEKLFGDWKPGALPELDLPALPRRHERSVYVVDRPGSAQSNIVIANEGITRTDSDYFPMLLMHTILGANASSRLFMNLREEKGYTYGAYSNLDARRLAGTFRATAEVRTPVTGASLHEFFYELGRIRDEAVSADELKNAKSYLSGVFPIRIETQD
ncbi:MAG TPA: pitrilysin family protein, partial [Pyrinomonadaceae bacterium]|nr:pitrilysin family protein [Pyrinomonadaceae bacterium]